MVVKLFYASLKLSALQYSFLQSRSQCTKSDAVFNKVKYDGSRMTFSVSFSFEMKVCDIVIKEIMMQLLLCV